MAGDATPARGGARLASDGGNDRGTRVRPRRRRGGGQLRKRVKSAGEGSARTACPATNPNALRHRAAHPRRLSRAAPPGASGRERPGARRAARLARRHLGQGPALEPLGKAMGYLDNQWAGLVRYCDDGRCGIDTNAVENSIRPFCLGRRSWLFADTVAGARASARLYSFSARRRMASSLTPTCVGCSPNCPEPSRSATSKRCCRPGSNPPT